MTAMTPEELERARAIWEKARWVDTYDESWVIIATAIRDAQDAKLEEAAVIALKWQSHDMKIAKRMAAIGNHEQAEIRISGGTVASLIYEDILALKSKE